VEAPQAVAAPLVFFISSLGKGYAFSSYFSIIDLLKKGKRLGNLSIGDYEMLKVW
jgi:hypothetical protein